MSEVVLRDLADVAPARPAASRPALSHKRLAGAAAGLLLVAGVGWYGYHWWTVARFFETTDDAYVGGDVTVIAPKVAGFIAAVAVTDNQAVHAGDLLISIDDRDYRAAVAKADAAVAGQHATLANIEATRRLQLAMIAQAAAEIASTDAESLRTRVDQSRYHALSLTAAGSVQSFEKADADYKKALAAGQKASAALEASQRQLDVIGTQTQQATAALAAALADRDTAQLNLGYTELRAPVAGTIGNRSARAGAFASAGVQVMAVVPATGLWVDANFKENQLAHMRPGLPVTIQADVLPGEVFHGHVGSLAPATGAQFSILPAENATGNFTKIVQRVPVRVVLDGDAGNLGRLRPGLSVTAAVDERP